MKLKNLSVLALGTLSTILSSSAADNLFRLDFKGDFIKLFSSTTIASGLGADYLFSSNNIGLDDLLGNKPIYVGGSFTYSAGSHHSYGVFKLDLLAKASYLVYTKDIFETYANLGIGYTNIQLGGYTIDKVYYGSVNGLIIDLSSTTTYYKSFTFGASIKFNLVSTIGISPSIGIVAGYQW